MWHGNHIRDRSTKCYRSLFIKYIIHNKYIKLNICIFPVVILVGKLLQFQMQSIFSKEMCLFHVYSLLFSLLLNKSFWEDKLLIWFKFSVLWIDSAVGMVNLWVTFFRGCATILTIIPGIALSNYMLRMSSWQRCSGADEWLPQWLLHILQVKSTCLRSRTERGRNGIPTQGPVVSTAMLLCNGSGMAARFLSGCCGLVAQSYLTLHDPMDCSPPGSSVHGIIQTRILKWFAISFSRFRNELRKIKPKTCVSFLNWNIQLLFGTHLSFVARMHIYW